MPKYAVYEIATASYHVGTYEADNADEAERMVCIMWEPSGSGA